MNIPNSSRINTENDILSSNFSNSDMKDDILLQSNVNNKTEQIRLRRNLLQSKYPIQNDENESPEISLIDETPEKPRIAKITFKEANKHFRTLIFPNGINNKKNSDCCSCSSEKTKNEKFFILSLKGIRYNQNDDIHFRILFTIYYFFKKKNCEKEGEHWQDIGFQSDSPKDDLITVGMLGPLQILYGIDYYPDLYSELFQYLLQRKCDLYFMANLVSLCKFGLNIMERNLLDDIVQENNNFSIILNEVFVGMVYEYNNEIKNYGINNVLTIEYIVKTIQNISEMRTQASYFINNHKINPIVFNIFC